MASLTEQPTKFYLDEQHPLGLAGNDVNLTEQVRFVRGAPIGTMMMASPIIADKAASATRVSGIDVKNVTYELKTKAVNVKLGPEKLQDLQQLGVGLDIFADALLRESLKGALSEVVHSMRSVANRKPPSRRQRMLGVAPTSYVDDSFQSDVNAALLRINSRTGLLPSFMLVSHSTCMRLADHPLFTMQNGDLSYGPLRIYQSADLPDDKVVIGVGRQPNSALDPIVVVEHQDGFELEAFDSMVGLDSLRVIHMMPRYAVVKNPAASNYFEVLDVKPGRRPLWKRLLRV